MAKTFRDLLNEVDPTPLTPGLVCRSFRRNFEFTLKDIEELTGLQQTNLSALENDRVEMTSYYAEKLASVFGIHPSLILYPYGWTRESLELSDIHARAMEMIKRRSVGR